MSEPEGHHPSFEVTIPLFPKLEQLLEELIRIQLQIDPSQGLVIESSMITVRARKVKS